MARELVTCSGSGHYPPNRSRTPDRARCGVCGRQTAINSDGRLRTHGRYLDADTKAPA